MFHFIAYRVNAPFLPLNGIPQIYICVEFLLRQSASFLSCSLTDEAYKMISRLPHLRFLDLCGAQV